jgi:FKBP-type peptidyl-prolyl cis-trans isomerase (trigger factor)
MELNNMKKIINNIEYDLTAEEISQREQDAIQAEQDRLAYEAEKQAKIDTKASALAKLSALGLTEEEVQAIIK